VVAAALQTLRLWNTTACGPFETLQPFQFVASL